MSTKSLIKSTELFPSVFDDFFKPWNEWAGNGGFPRKSMTLPAVNVTETKDEYKVSVAAPGLKKSDFNVNLEGNLLTISSEKEESKEDKGSRFNRQEYSYSSFSRSFTLPDDVKQDKIEATYEDGVLLLVLPKKEETKKLSVSKHIAIK